MADSPRFQVRFDEDGFAEDLEHATAAGRAVALGARSAMEQGGVPVDRLRACQAEGRDGTRLAGMVKVYLPPPDGPWGMVLRGARDRESGTPALLCVAFGRRHPDQPWQPSVYQVAHRRLHAGA